VKLPTLYKKTSTGAIEQWSIRVESFKKMSAPSGYAIVTEHGQVGGKLIESREVVTEGKNLGKANETTAKAQAESQAQSEWNTKKTRKGYCEELQKAEAGGNDGAGGIRPMLAKDFGEHKAKIKYNCYCQPKSDGIRCEAVVNADGSVSLWSREQKPILACPHISEAIRMLGLIPGTILDGELYNHDLKDDFEKIVSCVRKPYPASPEEQAMVQYHVYDLPSHAGNFGERTSWLNNNLPHDHAVIKLVPTFICTNEAQLIEYRKKFQAQGYEGAMARNDAPYEMGKRSYNLQKLKEFVDDDFPITGVKEGKGKMAGCAIFTCQAKNGESFDVKLEGALEGLRKYLLDDKTWKGKQLTVKYFSLTKKGIPRFPVGKAVRDYE
jgi:DNA ligase-1